jgi:hypothetical protein
VNVTVVAAGGTSATSSSNRFTFYNIPVVTGISPQSGPYAGGTLVTVSGSYFTGATAVQWNGVPLSFTFVSDNTVTATTNAQGPTSQYFTVVTPGGTSAATSGALFTGTTSVTGVSPNSGPTTGGTPVTISGVGFTGITCVTFGLLPVSSFAIVSDTQVTTTAPPGYNISTYDVLAWYNNFSSPASSADHYAYTATHWYGNWSRAQRLAITVPSGTTTPLAFFPVLLTAACLPGELTNGSKGRTDGGDLAFASDNSGSIGAQIPCEVVSASFGGSPSAEIWVAVPNIAATGTTTYIWVLYGNASQTSQPGTTTAYGSQAVWSEDGAQNFAAVWHFQGTGSPATFADSTALGTTLTNYNSNTPVTAGEIGSSLSFNGSNTRYLTGSDAVLPNGSARSITASVWFKAYPSPAPGSYLVILNYGYGFSSPGEELCMWLTDDSNGAGTFGVGSALYSSGTSSGGANGYCDGNWHLGTMTYDSGTTTTRYYVDGVAGTIANNLIWPSLSNSSVRVGGVTPSSSYANGPFNGLIDEIRLSYVVRTPSWIAAEYANQYNPGGFITPSGIPLVIGGGVPMGILCSGQYQGAV